VNILVYGVTYWDTEEDINSRKEQHLEWYRRVQKFIPENKEIFITAGSYSPPEYNPLPCKLYQAPLFRPLPYSKQNCYFRHGFLTGIWKSLIDYRDIDLIVHCQTRHFLGIDLTQYLEEFLQRDELLMSINFTGDNNCLQGIDVGFMVMKPAGALLYTIRNYRQTCDEDMNCLNCEEEALEIYKDLWWNPWPDIPTFKQIDWIYREEPEEIDGTIVTTINPDTIKTKQSRSDITDIEYFKQLPMIATGHHVTEEFYQAWLKAHPIT